MPGCCGHLFMEVQRLATQSRTSTTRPHSQIPENTLMHSLFRNGTLLGAAKRTTRRSSLFIAIASASLALSSLAAPAAMADVCVASTVYSSSQSFNYQRCQMTDADQKRKANLATGTPGLPNDGNMYCVPTVALDLLAYIANHGYANVAPGSGWYGPEAGPPPHLQYNKMTSAIAQMGVLMNTSPNNGTGSAAAVSGIKQWLTNTGAANFTVTGFTNAPKKTVRLNHMAAAAVDGAVIESIVGWYQGSAQSGYMRVGGHALALAGAERTGGVSTQVSLRDPAKTAPGDDLFSQSAFTTETYEVKPELSTFNGTWRIQDRVVGLGGNGFVDGYYAINPPHALTSEWNVFILLKPWKLQREIDPPGPPEPPELRFQSANNRPIVDLAVDPVQPNHPYLVEGDSTIWELDALSGRSTALATVDGAKRLILAGPDQNIIVATTNGLVSLSREGQELNRVALSAPLAAIAYDTKRDLVLGLSATGDLLYTFDQRLTPQAKVLLPERTCADGKVSVQYDPATGDLVLHCDGSASVTRFSLVDGRVTGWNKVALEGARSPLGLTVGDQGQILMSDGGAVVEFDGAGHHNDRSAFRGLPGGSRIDIRRSFDNFDPRQDADPAFRNGTQPMK